MSALREGLQRVMDERGLKAGAWAERAGVDKHRLYRFMRGETRDLGAGDGYLLAQAAGFRGIDDCGK